MSSSIVRLGSLLCFCLLLLAARNEGRKTLLERRQRHQTEIETLDQESRKLIAALHAYRWKEGRYPRRLQDLRESGPIEIAMPSIGAGEWKYSSLNPDHFRLWVPPDTRIEGAETYCYLASLECWSIQCW